MSSHHFVKEGQEPALIILDRLAFQHAESLLQWVPLILVADYALENVLSWGIKIDVVLHGEYPLEMLEEAVRGHGPIQILKTENDQVITRALEFLIRDEYDAVNLLINPREEVFREVERSAHKLQVGIYNDQEKWSLISSRKFEKWMPAGVELSIRNDLPIQTEGLLQKGTQWETINSGIAAVRSESPFWIGETR